MMCEKAGHLSNCHAH